MPEQRITIGPAFEVDQAMPIRAVVTTPPDWVIGAFKAAVERVRVGAQTDTATSRGIGIPLAEALMWLDVLQSTSRDVGRGRDIAEKLAQDPVLKALKFVRGRVHHHWASATSFDGEAEQWTWRIADNFPLPPGQRHRNAKGSFRSGVRAARPGRCDYCARR
jgi:hypothetical protein